MATVLQLNSQFKGKGFEVKSDMKTSEIFR